jgi:lipopolysaccharide transport system ATP-binding protein
MAGFAISARALGKRYAIGVGRSHDTLRDLIAASARRLWGPSRSVAGLGRADHFWALDDVSFDVQPGEVLGVVGRNGAGKSTLLKVLSRITEPSAGEVRIRGRVGSLIEVGTGFHPELTGRENVFLNGAILGMSRSEIARKFDEIVAFAEVERFLDTPVKRYSSGMYLRLGFAVAAHLEPEILIVDEVLAVGDSEFQRKCLGKMQAVGKEGRTVIFVSHNTSAVESLCSRAILLESGRVRADGPVGSVMREYARSFPATGHVRTWTECARKADGCRAWFRRIAAMPVGADEQEPIRIATPFVLEFDVSCVESDVRIEVSFALYSDRGVLILDIAPPACDALVVAEAGVYRTTCFLPGGLFNEGVYRVAAIVCVNGVPAVEEPDALGLVIEDSPELRGGWYGEWPGILRPAWPWDVNRRLALANDGSVV